MCHSLLPEGSQSICQLPPGITPHELRFHAESCAVACHLVVFLRLPART